MLHTQIDVDVMIWYFMQSNWFTFSQRQLRPAYYMLKFIPDARFYHLVAFLLYFHTSSYVSVFLRSLTAILLNYYI